MRVAIMLFVLLSSFFVHSASILSSRRDDDLVKKLPGLRFDPNFNIFSGYLKAGMDGAWKMHYVLMESQNDSENDPLIVWFNGGPGCSSFSGLLTELGPFYVNRDGETLFENIYAWNKKANVLALESPIGVGFSYDTFDSNYTYAHDDQTNQQNYDALYDFFKNVRPDLQKNPIFIAGESYAGVYVPMLVSSIISGIEEKTFPSINLKGAAIGNGFMHVQHSYNSLVVWSAYHGRISPDKWDKAKDVCRTGGLIDHDKYDYVKFMYSSNGMDYKANTSTECGKIIDKLITDYEGKNVGFNAYNYYQDCYNLDEKLQMNLQHILNNSDHENPSLYINHESTDSVLGYPCWSEDAISSYLNKQDVQDALHIDKKWQKRKQDWEGCNDDIYDQYKMSNPNMNKYFMNIFKKLKIDDFRFLIYTGDVDTVCNFLGTSWFMRDVAHENNMTSTERSEWMFTDEIAGYNQHYFGKNTEGKTYNIDVLTVKGAGHFVPTDRPGPALQMITNFMHHDSKEPVDYSSTYHISYNQIVKPDNHEGKTNVNSIDPVKKIPSDNVVIHKLDGSTSDSNVTYNVSSHISTNQYNKGNSGQPSSTLNTESDESTTKRSTTCSTCVAIIVIILTLIQL